MFRSILIVVSLAGISACAVDAGDPAAGGPVGGKADDFADSGGRWAVTASALETIGRDLSSVEPAVENADSFHAPESYLGANGPLGPAGPIGAWGPLGALGPIGRNTWNPSVWVSAVPGTSWDTFCTSDSPLGEDGPLGPDGPLSREAYASLATWTNSSGEPNDFVEQLQAGGVWTVLGPLGPLGALGPLGPLGPVGSHCAHEGRGFAPDDEGNYVTESGEIVRTVDVPYGRTTRTYELFEHYSEAYATGLADNDTSFMATGSITNVDDEVDTYLIRSRVSQIVTLVLVPENALSDFDVELATTGGETIASSISDGRQLLAFGVPTNTGNYIDFVQLPVPEGAEVQVRVTAWRVMRTFPTYRLIVVGATEAFQSTEIRGGHQLRQ
jgi:hypothetical protein